MVISYLKSLVDEDLYKVDNIIFNNINSDINIIKNLINYTIYSGGKRLRPLLVLLTSHACGYKGKNHIILAAMIEFFHTATLLHDDVIDSSSLRRGKKTTNTLWGSKASILVGDYFFTKSVQLMVDVNHPKVLRLLSDISYKISYGELKQLVNRYNTTLSVNDYFDMIRCKTALLFAASSVTGAFLSNANTEIESSLYNYGIHLGNAFQLIDDALDYCSDARIIGKNIGDDLADGKITFPLLHILQYGNTTQKKKICNSIKHGNINKLNEILSIIKETKAIEATKQYANIEIINAINCLKAIPNTKYKKALIMLANFILQRKS